MNERPALSVVVATTQPWPEARPCVDSFWAEARELGAEVLVADRGGPGIPADAYPGVVSLSEPGATVYRLRELGFAAARGDVVVTTEDHCVASPGWLRRHLDAHRDHPEVAAVGGPVGNGARRRLIDWAIFLVNHAPWMPPVEAGEQRGVDRANISYKHRVLPSQASLDGRAEPVMDEALAARGERFWLDSSNGVEHIQSFGLPGTVSIVFQNGRAMAGLHVERGLSVPARALRALASPLVAVITLRRVLGAVARRPRKFSARAFGSLALVPVLAVSIAAGFAVGYLAGTGRSAAHIR